MRYKHYSVTILSIAALGFGSASFMEYIQATDYLGVPGPIKYEGIEYNLAWSASSEKTYFKQEYLPGNSQPDKFSQMILIEALITNYTLEDIIRIKLTELEKRKKDDPVVNYKLLNKPDKNEYLLDFLVSEGKDHLTMVEWNAYRYEVFKDSAGHRGVMIFGVVRRETENITGFLNSLGELRKQQIKTLASYLLPEVKLAIN